MDKQSIILDYAKKVLQGLIDSIDKGECDEETISYFMERINTEHKGCFNEQTFVNYDEAMKLLHLRNRTTFRELLTRHGIKSFKVKNRNMGFLRTDIERLARDIQKQEDAFNTPSCQQ